MTSTPRPARPGRRRLVLAAVPVALTVTAVVVAIVPGPGPADPAAAVRDDQFVYIDSQVRFPTYMQPAGAVRGASEVSMPSATHRRQVWFSVDGSMPGLLVEADGAGDSRAGVRLDPVPEPSIRVPTYRFLSTMTTEPRALLDEIMLATAGEAKGLDPNHQAFDAIGSLLREAVVPAALGPSLYRAAALIPGVGIGEAADAAGRRGVTVGLADPRGVVTQWIFDPVGYEYWGERVVARHAVGGLPAGTVLGLTSVTRRGVVDEAGQQPM